MHKPLPDLSPIQLINRRWLADSFPSLPPDAFAWADGASFAHEWERDLVARSELAGASKDDALRAYKAFHALGKKMAWFMVA